MITDAALSSACPDIDDLLDEVAGKNHVRVVKYETVKVRGRFSLRVVMDELSTATKAMPHALVLQDSIRALRGLKPIYVNEALRRVGGEWVGAFANLRTTVGADFVAAQLSGTTVAQADWIALSNNTVAVAAGDTSNVLPWNTAQAADAAASGTTGEWTGLGLARKVATYAHTASTATYTLAATWTATSAATATSKAGLFGGAAKTTQNNGATNILFLENTFTATTLAINDQLSLTWTVTV